MNLQIFADKSAGNLNLEALISLFKSVDWPHAEYPEKLLSSLAKSQEVITAFDDNKLVGIMNAVGDGNFYAYIHWLIVHPDYQNKGIAKMLTKRMLEKLESCNQVFVIAESFMQKFWTDFGFVILKGDKKSKLIAAYRAIPELGKK